MLNYFRYDTWVKTAQGPALAGAQIWVATQPANVVTTPITPLALIYADPQGLVPIVQPILTDGFGHADFYVLAGLYTVVVAYNGIVQNFYPDQSLGGIGTGGGGTALVLSTNGVANTSQTAFNLQNTDGALTLSSDAFGNVTINNPAIPAGGTTGQVLTKLSGANFATQWTTPASSTVSVAGQGFFFGDGLTEVPQNTTSGSPVTVIPNQVVVQQFILHESYTLRTLAVNITTNQAGQFCAFGIYSAVGVKLLDTGPIPASAVGVQVVALTPTVIPAGVYYFAQTATTGNVQVPCNNSGLVLSMITTLGSVNPYNAIAANPSSAGVLPATLGTLTATTQSTYQGISSPLWMV